MFFNNFVDLCNKKRISPSAAAEEMGFKRSVVTRWSQGTQPRQATLQRIADYFGVTVEELTAEKGNKPALPQENELDELRRKAIEELLKASDKKIEAVIALLSDK